MSQNNFEDLTKQMRHIPNMDDTFGGPAPEPVPSTMPNHPNNMSDAIRQATGLNINPDQLIPRAVAPNQDVVSESQKNNGFKEFLTPEEAAQFGLNGPGVHLDPEQMADTERNAKADAHNKAKNADLFNMIDDAMKNEEQRVIDIDKKLSDPDSRAEIYTSPNDPEGKTTYTPPIEAEPGANVTQMKREPVATDAPDPDDLVPAYDFTEDTKTPEATEPTPEDTRPTEKNSEKEYAEYIQKLTVVDYDEDDSVVKIVKEKAVVDVVDSGRNRTKILGDQAFLNSITKFKKDNFRTVDVPLVNSGFMASMVGTGAVDLTLLYDQTNQSTTAVDYELEKMRIVIRNVVDTHPRIDRNDLRNMIHFGDYQIMAYAHVVATLAKVELVQTCTDCGKDFRITANSRDLLLNMNELRDKQNMITSSTSISQCSLMDRDRKMSDKDGFQIFLGHPSYVDYIQYLAELRQLTEQLNRGQATRIAQMADILPFVRKIGMPNGVYTNNLYQRFLAVTMLSDGTYNQMVDMVHSMAKEIITPKFGIRKVVCPHCGKVNTDITYDNLNDLLFFHIMVSRLLNATEV